MPQAELSLSSTIGVALSYPCSLNDGNSILSYNFRVSQVVQADGPSFRQTRNLPWGFRDRFVTNAKSPLLLW